MTFQQWWDSQGPVGFAHAYHAARCAWDAAVAEGKRQEQERCATIADNIRPGGLADYVKVAAETAKAIASKIRKG